MAEIRISGISKRYGGYTALHALDLTVKDREFLVLLGASGCGKTTLLRLIAGLDSPSAGDIRIGERSVTALPPRARGIAMVFQNYAVFPHLTVSENIAFGLRMKKLAQAEVERRTRRAAGMMHIESLLDRYSGQLSGGQRQRVAVARALAMEPEVLLMDEPLSNLDALLRLEMRAELKGVLQESRTTTIYVTHDQVEAMSLADRIAVMNQGRIVQVGTPIDIYRDPADRFVGAFIGSPPMNFLTARPRDGTWQVADMPFSGPPVNDAKLELGIRPEDIVVAERGLPAEVKVVEPLGAHQLLTTTVAGHPFRAVVDSDLRVRPGEILHLQPRTDRMRWFDAETGHAVG